MAPDSFQSIATKDLQYSNMLMVGVPPSSQVSEKPVIALRARINDALWRIYPQDSNLIFRITSGEKRIIYIEGSTSEGLAIGITSGMEETAQLELNSTDKGFLPPRMTTAQKNAISSPATGLMVYDTTLNKLCVYTGSAWETITSS